MDFTDKLQGKPGRTLLAVHTVDVWNSKRLPMEASLETCHMASAKTGELCGVLFVSPGCTFSNYSAVGSEKSSVQLML